MSMTREQAIKFAEHAVNMTDIPDVKEFYGLSAAALRGPTREQVERMRGEWIDKPTGRYGQRQAWCTACGKHSGIGGIKSNQHKPFCPNCGALMDGKEDKDEAD